MKPAAWVGLAIIIAAIAFGARSFVTNLTPYLTFEQARKARGSVQVMGKLDKKSIEDRGSKALKFVLLDDAGDRLPVVFSDTRPANLEQATQITAIGKYDGTAFQADRLLVKCPSKYQGTETKEYGKSASLANPLSPR